MAIHRTVLRTYQQLWYSDQLKSRLATLDSSQETLLQVMCVDWDQHSQISPTTSLWRFRAQEKLFNSQQRARKHEAISVQCRVADGSTSSTFNSYCFSAADCDYRVGVYIHGQVTFCVHGLRSLDQWFCVSSSDSISVCIIVSKSIVLVDNNMKYLKPGFQLQLEYVLVPH